MATDADVVVVGGGLAGCTAALAAARADPAAAVRLLSAGESTLEAATGLVDVLGYTPDGDGPIVNPFDVIDDLPADHPYSVVGVDAIRAGLAMFDDVTTDRYQGDHTEKNALVPTYGGSVKPTARYPSSVAPGLASIPERTLLVGFKRLTPYAAQLVADQLTDAMPPFMISGLEIEFPLRVTEYPAAPRYASALEANEPVGDGMTLRETLADQLLGVLGSQARVGVPAVLGYEETSAIREEIEAVIDTPVFELPMGPPSVPGRRLKGLLDDAILDAGVDVRTESRVVDVDSRDGRVASLAVETAEGTQEHRAEAYVLATGGVTGGGVASDRSGVCEPVFDCHVAHPSDRDAWSEPDALADHPFASFGVSTDTALRPRDATGAVEYQNLHAAGSVIGGYNFAAEKSGSGVSLATGLVAGRRAVE